MNYPLILSLISAHFLADFILQPRKMAEKKSSDWEVLFCHCTIVALSFMVVVILLGYKGHIVVAFFAINFIAHFITDLTTWNAYKFIRRKETPETFQYWKDYIFYWVIGIDQWLHISVLILSTMVLSR